jgi:hypothetical protein
VHTALTHTLHQRTDDRRNLGRLLRPFATSQFGVQPFFASVFCILAERNMINFPSMQERYEEIGHLQAMSAIAFTGRKSYGAHTIWFNLRLS